MVVTLRGLQTAVPPTILVQDQVRDVFAAQHGLSRLAQRLVTTSFNMSGIETRRTVIEELTLDPGSGHSTAEPQFFDSETQQLLSPSTGLRNELYIVEATKLFVEAGRLALAACPDVEAADITHVVTVSCTGFYAPGPDYMLVRELGLNPATQRYHLGFMGCYASMPALRTAKQFVDANPDAVVLVVSAELCSLHLRSSSDPDTIVASSLFGDGAAAGIVSARHPVPGEKAFTLDHFETVITPVGEGAMAWKIGDAGFEMVLSSYVPHIIDEHIEGALAPLLAKDEQLSVFAEGMRAETVVAADAALQPDGARQVATLEQPLDRAIAHWAIHPGGRSILDKTEAKLALREEQLVPSREVLRTYGNMSSATVLFVMKAILDSDRAEDGDRTCAMAFGPGLTVESALLSVIRG
ncbi:type III polyketide synthase [Leifsonia sp. A12D58]|uniref:type III polyketide synthase n=1 Tax=Leifsonia sp. A12D58 TaxID=3397674 RepID=UPI0039E17C1B